MPLTVARSIYSIDAHQHMAQCHEHNLHSQHMKTREGSSAVAKLRVYLPLCFFSYRFYIKGISEGVHSAYQSITPGIVVSFTTNNASWSGKCKSV
jgi:hypothetical protein